MYPSRSAMDYNLSELNKLFGATENDLFNSVGTASSLSGSFKSIIQSSSSTETSPESYPETPHTLSTNADYYDRYQIPTQQTFPEPSCSQTNYEIQRPDLYDFMSHYDSRLPETPVRRPRPIIGRKIQHTNVWQPESMEWNDECDRSPKQMYELFPIDKERSPVKCSPIHASPSLTNYRTPEKKLPMNTFIPRSPTNSLMNSSMSTLSTSPRICSPLVSTPVPPASPMGYFKEPGRSNKVDSSNICTFCRKNGEAPVVFNGHVVKRRVGSKQVVECPILRSLVCAICGESGDNAHTITYCPVLRNSNNGQPLRSTTITLKNTRVMSNGRRRY